MFTNAYSTIPFTLPAHISLLTGQHHAVHGVINDQSRLSPAIPTLPELLQDSGFSTAGLYTTEWLDAGFGFGRGFGHYEMLPHAPRYADRVTQRALRMIDEDLGERQPFFLFLHLFDAHSDFGNQSGTRLPYYSPSSYREHLPANHQNRFCVSKGSGCSTSFLVAADKQDLPLSAEDTRLLEELYTLGIECLDSDLGDLFAGLRQREIYDDALIIVLSDHGEEFREHGKLIHSQVYDETVAIPLLVKLPGNEGGGSQIDELVTLMSVHGMIKEATGVSASTGRTTPAALARHAHREILLQDKLRREVWAVRSGPWKLVERGPGQGEELYHLGQDAAETTNLANSQPDVTQKLSELLSTERDTLLALRAVQETPGLESTSILDAEERRRLEALGYVD